MGKTHELDHPFSNATIGISSPHYPLQHASCTRCFEQGISLKADEIVFLFDLAGRTRSHGSRSRSHSISRGRTRGSHSISRVALDLAGRTRSRGSHSRVALDLTGRARGRTRSHGSYSTKKSLPAHSRRASAHSKSRVTSNRESGIGSAPLFFRAALRGWRAPSRSKRSTPVPDASGRRRPPSALAAFRRAFESICRAASATPWASYCPRAD